MASEPTRHHFESFDGQALVWREIGAGRPVVLLHGYMSDAVTNWIRYGHADAIAARGHRVIMPDLRAHGDSAKPHDADAYPPDVLAHDGLALLRHLELDDFDLGGYSLGARTTVRMLALGAAPRRAVISGMGYEGVSGTARRGAFFRKVLTSDADFERGSPEWMAQAFLKTTGGDAKALVNIIDSFVDTSDEELARIAMPTLVLSGVDDHDNGSAAELAGKLPGATLREVPGNHMSAVLKPDLGIAIADFLAT